MASGHVNRAEKAEHMGAPTILRAEKVLANSVPFSNRISSVKSSLCSS
jgi:hypothetical protein